ncbi:MAG: DUF1194 domain-containing protein, partial [Alphaproteobacteria bacterium]|nr:DUF1194 domain-containing protein [Alphaproteobacteria bacterium]
MRRRGVLVSTAALVVARAAAGQTARRVDVELVLAIDGSLSIDDEEFRLQAEGTAAAFTDPAVIRALTGGESGAIAVAFVQWAGPLEQSVSIAWTLIDGRAAAYRFAEAIR